MEKKNLFLNVRFCKNSKFFMFIFHTKNIHYRLKSLYQISLYHFQELDQCGEDR